MSTSSNRHTLVNLSVVAGSAAMFAIAWAGITGADGDRYAQADLAMPEAQVAVSPQAASPPATTVDAPAPEPRQVVIVRQSTAS